MITKVTLKNYRNVEVDGLELSPLTVFIGPNGCGKSNLFRGIRFLLRAMTMPTREAIRSEDDPAFLVREGAVPEVVGGELEMEAPGYRIRASVAVEPFAARVVDECYELTGEASLKCERVERGYRLDSGQGPVEATAVPTEAIPAPKRASPFPSPFAVWVRAGKLDLPEYMHGRPSPPSRVTKLLDDASASFDLAASPVHGSRASIVAAGHATDEDLDMDCNAPLATMLERLWNSDALIEHKRQFQNVVEAFMPEFEDFKFPRQADLKTAAVLRTAGAQRGLPLSAHSDGIVSFLRTCAIICTRSNTADKAVVLEEPEVGLHPHAVKLLAEFLVEQSDPRQILVSTHSPDLIEDLDPSQIVVVDREPAESFSTFRFRNLSSRDDLEGWLKRYKMGELWQKGVLGAR